MKLKLTRYLVLALAFTGYLAAQTLEVSITIKPEWHAAFQKGVANLNQQRARSGEPSQTPTEFLREAMAKVVFSIADNMNQPVDKPADLQKADADMAEAKRSRQELFKLMFAEPPPE